MSNNGTSNFPARHSTKPQGSKSVKFEAGLIPPENKDKMYFKPQKKNKTIANKKV
jgi:hypothetical protein